MAIYWWWLPLFWLGASGGSFLGVLLSRYRRQGRLDVAGRSHCDACGRQLSWQENIPLISYLLLKGRCRSCGAKISREYFVLELLGGLLAVSAFNFSLTQGAFSWLSSILYLLIFWLLLAIFFFDYHFRLIPDFLIIPLIFLGLLLPRPSFLAAFAGMIFFVFLYAATAGRGMGLGDAKLAFALGIFLGGWRLALAIYLAFIVGGITAVVLLWRGRKKLKSKIAFGPFLVLSAIISWLAGNIILAKLPC